MRGIIDKMTATRRTNCDKRLGQERSQTAHEKIVCVGDVLTTCSSTLTLLLKEVLEIIFLNAIVASSISKSERDSPFN